MSYRNEVLLSGKAFNDASQPSPRAPHKFTLTQGGGKKKDSDERGPVCFYPVICWQGKCDGPAAEVKKGDFVEVTGRLQHREYTAKDGTKRSAYEVIAATVTIQPKQSKPITPAYADNEAGAPW